jgi:hypothetical protein
MAAQQRRLSEAVSEGRFGKVGESVVYEGTGGGDFAEETVLLISALRLWGENAWANGGESSSSGAGGVEKGEPGSLASGGAKARGRGGVCR